MARQLYHGRLSNDTSLMCFGLASFVICAAALLACTYHGQLWRRFPTGRRHSSGPITTIHQVQPSADNICVWQKGIIMGEKCRYPEFSGIINYDTAGNMINADTPTAPQIRL